MHRVWLHAEEMMNARLRSGKVRGLGKEQSGYEHEDCAERRVSLPAKGARRTPSDAHTHNATLAECNTTADMESSSS